MPNWCKNELELLHDDPSKIQEAIEAFNAGRLLSYFRPEPKHKDDNAWYSWRNENWGTKWDVGGEEGEGDCIVFSDENQVAFIFMSAWSPPIEAYAVARVVHGFRINASYDEPGMCFAGRYVGGSDGEGSIAYVYHSNRVQIVDAPSSS